MTIHLRPNLLASTILMGAAVITSPALAQPAPAPAPTPNQRQAVTNNDEEVIIVTGTRIRDPNVVALQPVQAVTSENIEQSGAINIQDVLDENPAFGTPDLSRANSAFLTSGAGVAEIDLRDIGPDRTLVLINSRRVVAGIPGTTSVDVNVIPTQFIDRVDVLTGGASSLYGSDAVAGVVNIIYKRNFQGLLIDGQAGISEHGDAGHQQISATGGINFGGGRGNLMVHAGYDNEDGLLARQRKLTQVDQLSKFWYFTGDPADYFTSVKPFFSSFVPQGRFDVNKTSSTRDDFTFDQNTGQLRKCFNANFDNPCPGQTVADGFNRQNYRTLLTPVKRYLAAFTGHYDITDSIRFIAEGTYAKTKAATEIEPFPLDSGGSTGPYRATAGRAPIESIVNGVKLRNAFVPDAIFNAATDTNGDGLKDIAFARRLSDLSTRNFTADRDFYRFVGGFEGDLFNKKWHWDVTFNYGRAKEKQESNGDINVVNFRNAFESVRNPATGQIVCASGAAGCVPLNIFGANTITPGAAAYIDANTTHSFDTRQMVLAANATGSLIDLPAGPLSLAVGGEWRREKSSEDWDPITNAGLTAGNQLPDTKGKVTVKEIYGELNVPIFKEQPFAYELNLRAAGRLSDYSTVGTVKTWNVGGDYAPAEAIRFRGTYSVAIRAPNIGELFQGPAQTFPTGLVDPCSVVNPNAPAGQRGVTLTSSDPTSVLCRTQPGVISNINANGGFFTLTQADIQGISGFNIGNPTLREETAKTLTAGVVITPKFINALRNLTLTVDYYRINIKNAIITPNRAELLDQCYTNLVADLCSLIIRRPTGSGSNSPGSIEFVNAQAINSGVLKTSGIDTTVTYRTNMDWLKAGSTLSARLAYTHLFKGFTIAFPNTPVKDVFAGEIGTSKDRANGTLTWDTGGFQISFTGTYIGKAREDDRSLDVNTGLPPDAIKIPAKFYLDTQIRVRPEPRLELFVGVDNLLDTKPPLIFQGSVFNTTGHITAADVYDDIGRRFYAGARIKLWGAEGTK
jgi:iron complex outermembrane receptor protein